MHNRQSRLAREKFAAELFCGFVVNFERQQKRRVKIRKLHKIFSKRREKKTASPHQKLLIKTQCQFSPIESQAEAAAHLVCICRAGCMIYSPFADWNAAKKVSV